MVLAGPEPFTSRRRAMKRAKEVEERIAAASPDDQERAAERASTRLSWANAFKRAWGLDLLECDCGGRKRVIATITDHAVVRRILAHVGLDHERADVESIRGPPEVFEPEPDAAWPADDEAADGGDGPGEIDIPPLDEAA